MHDPLYFLSKDDLEILKRIIQECKNSRVNTPLHTEETNYNHLEGPSNDIYIAYSGYGISPMSTPRGTAEDDTPMPGVATCSILGITSSTSATNQYLLSDIDYQEPVLNISLQSVPPDTFILVQREKTLGLLVAINSVSNGGESGTDLTVQYTDESVSATAVTTFQVEVDHNLLLTKVSNSEVILDWAGLNVQNEVYTSGSGYSTLNYGPERTLTFIEPMDQALTITCVDDTTNERVTVAFDLSTNLQAVNQYITPTYVNKIYQFFGPTGPGSYGNPPYPPYLIIYPGPPYSVLWTEGDGATVVWSQTPQVYTVSLGVADATEGGLEFYNSGNSNTFTIEPTPSQHDNQTVQLPSYIASSVNQFLGISGISGSVLTTSWLSMSTATVTVNASTDTIESSLSDWTYIAFATDFFTIRNNASSTGEPIIDMNVGSSGTFIYTPSSGAPTRPIWGSLTSTGSTVTITPGLTGINLEVAAGGVILAGDVTGAANSNTVVKIQGKSVSNTAPTGDQALIYNSSTSKWTPTTFGGDVSSSGLSPGELKVVGFYGISLNTAAATDAEFYVYDLSTAVFNPVVMSGDANMANSGVVTVSGWGGVPITPIAGATDAQIFIYDSSTTKWVAHVLSGDATMTNAGVVSLATVNSNVGSFGSASQTLNVTVNAKGLITAISASNIAISASQVSGLPSGTVTTFSAGSLSTLFTTSVANATTTPALTFTLSNAAQGSVLAGPASGGSGAPSYQTAPTISAANMTNFPTFNQSTTGNAGTATSLAGGANGDIPYQTASGTTAFLSPNATGSTDAVLTSTSASGSYSSTSLKNAPALSPAKFLAGGPGILGVASYAPSSYATYTAGTSLAALDTTNLKVTFTAPASGNVLVILSAYVYITTGVSSYYYGGWGLLSGGSQVGNAVRMHYANNSSFEYQASCSIYVTGLTPGTSYTFQWASFATNASCTFQTFASANVSSSPANAFGPATMSVFASP